jgi:tRNA pseudouridine55 synthase
MNGAEHTPPTPASGVLVVDKAAGWTSHDVVARLRRITGERRIGHAGTLDPAATGVLVVCQGAATRIVEYLAELTKTYLASVTFGVETDTWDSEGAVISERATASLSLPLLSESLARFTGEIDQIPPMYSALKHDGTPLYRLARRGETIDRAPRRVTIHRVTVLRWSDPVLEIEVVCGKGTYIRSLAHDLGEASGTGAHLAALRRTAVGHFTQIEALSLDALSQDDRWRQALQTPADALRHLPAVVLDASQVADLRFGRTVSLPESMVPGTVLCAFGPERELVAVLRPDEQAGRWRPDKVFSGRN